MTMNKAVLKIKRRMAAVKEENAPVMFESSSIGDLAFLLLIFFIITGSFLLRQGIFFSLPSADGGSIRIEEKRFVEVYPRNEGFEFNDELVSREILKGSLAGKIEEVSEPVLIIHMGERVKYDRLVDTLSLAKEAGITQVSLKNINGDEEYE